MIWKLIGISVLQGTEGVCKLCGHDIEDVKE